MEYKPPVGARVRSHRGVIGTVTSWPKKLQHQDKVMVAKDGQIGANARVMVKFFNLERLQ